MDVTVIGAGVVGLAVARRLALDGRRVTVVEAELSPGQHTSSHGSWVIHAGIYYPPGSLKAQLCVRGRHMLYDYCATRGVTAKRLGKIIVATSQEQVHKLQALLANGHKNGVSDLRWMAAEEARSLEPNLHCVAALFSPSTGVIDGHGLMQALREDAEAAGAQLLLRHQALGGDMTGAVKAVHVVNVNTGEQRMLRAGCVINAAGLWAQHIAAGFVGLERRHIPPLHVARGCYFRLKGAAPFKHLIYPLPEEAGLGTHLTLDVAGGVKFGPDSHWVAWNPSEKLDYSADPTRGEEFYAAIRKYWPGLRDGQLDPGYSGVRPKLAGPGQAPADFVIQGELEHGVSGLVNLFGIESPGFTSSLAIAEEVAALLGADKTEAAGSSNPTAKL